MAFVKRISQRQDELELKLANKIGINANATAENQTDRRVFRWELVVEFDDVEQIVENNQVQRSGKQAWVTLELDVLNIDTRANLNIYTVALSTVVKNTKAKFRFRHGGFPESIEALMPPPSQFQNLTLDKYHAIFDSIETAIKKLGSDGFGSEVPPVDSRFLRDNGNFTEEERYTSSVCHALDNLAWLLTGRTIWDAENWAKREGKDHTVVDDLYAAMGSHRKPHLIPRAAAHRKAKEWMKLIYSGRSN